MNGVGEWSMGLRVGPRRKVGGVKWVISCSMGVCDWMRRGGGDETVDPGFVVSASASYQLVLEILDFIEIFFASFQIFYKHKITHDRNQFFFFCTV